MLGLGEETNGLAEGSGLFVLDWALAGMEHYVISNLARMHALLGPQPSPCCLAERDQRSLRQFLPERVGPNGSKRLAAQGSAGQAFVALIGHGGGHGPIGVLRWYGTGASAAGGAAPGARI